MMYHTANECPTLLPYIDKGPGLLFGGLIHEDLSRASERVLAYVRIAEDYRGPGYMR